MGAVGQIKFAAMSYLSTALNRLAERHEMKQADVVRETGLTRSHVSRIFSGDQRTVTDEDFIALLRAFARHVHTQAELVAARCADARVGPGAELVTITVKSPDVGTKSHALSGSDFSEVELSHETEKAFAWLRSQCPVNPDLEKHLVGFARLTGMR